ncbi:hypothetical protein [Brevundimonas sp. NIBR11]|uniref:hypothetical protein n=1 Tax=Brevundimonas sp. NIBR11 TaxID=3015999 RepID=UPI0022F00717|nr:hypothetical protein [Brevundimonas sp. NIBR11]WGM30054.1 hypothetical protein KKHFBJBL_00269 [Brevundimonas sp. NIBR11]
MIIALLLASLLAVQSSVDFWVVTEASDREVSAVNVGFAFVPEGKDYVLAAVHTEHRQGTAATRWTTPASTDEFLAFRCADGTFLVRGSYTYSGVADPIRTSDPDGVFVSVAIDPKRQKQADAVCRPETVTTPRFRTLSGLLQAHGIQTGPTAVTPRLVGPQPYPVSREERGRQAREPEQPHPPRIGISASHAHNPGGGLVIGYATHRGGRWVSEFYSMGAWPSNPAAEPVIFVRRALDSWEVQEQIQWADSRTCSGLTEVLRPANDLALPILILPLDEASRMRIRETAPPPPPMADGPGPHIFWAPGRGQTGHEIQFSSFGGPWVDWANSVDRVLEPCWQDERPVRPPDA